MPVSPCDAWMRTGGRPSFVSMRAPMRASGSATRRIGRRDRLSSPTSVDAKRWPASSPISSRIAVPALPQSSAESVPTRPSTPTPCTVTRPWDGPSMRTPSARKTFIVEIASAPSRNPVT